MERDTDIHKHHQVRGGLLEGCAKNRQSTGSSRTGWQGGRERGLEAPQRRVSRVGIVQTVEEEQGITGGKTNRSRGTNGNMLVCLRVAEAAAARGVGRAVELG